MQTHTPSYGVGDSVVVTPSTPGHDAHDPKGFVRIVEVYPGADARGTHYLLQGSPSLWPETRLHRRAA